MYPTKVDKDFLKDLAEEFFNTSVFLISRNEKAYETYKNLCETIPNVNSPYSVTQNFIEFPERVIKFKDTLYEFQNGVKPLSDNRIKTSEDFLIYSIMDAEKIKNAESLEYGFKETLEMISKIFQDNPEFFV